MVYLIITTFCAFFIKGVAGFANTLVFSSMMSFQAANRDISPLELLLGYPSNAILMLKGIKRVKFKQLYLIVLLVLLGNIPGVWLLSRVNAHHIKIVFGIVIMLFSAKMGVELYLKKKKKEKSTWITFSIGILSGLLSGLFGIGALLAVYVDRISDNNEDFKANMCTIFFIENTFRIGLYIFSGLLTVSLFLQALSMMPIVLLALLLGMKLSERLDALLVRKIVIVMLFFSGFSLLFQA